MRAKIQFYVNISIVAIIVASAVSYAYFETREMLAGPELSINFPQNMATLKENSTFITGIAKNTSFISLNGRPILIDKEGNFKEKVIFPDGYSSIALIARDRFDKEISKKLEVIVRGERKELKDPNASTTPEILVRN